MKFDPYEILGVARDAPQDAIKPAFKKRSKEVHPDVNGTGDDAEFKLVKQAYDILSDPDARVFFDQTGLAQEVGEEKLYGEMVKLIRVSLKDTIKFFIEEGTRINSADVLKMMKENIATGMHNLDDLIDAMMSQIADLEAMRDEINKTADVDNVFSLQINELVDERKAVLIEYVNAHKVVEMAFAEMGKHNTSTEMMANVWKSSFRSGGTTWNTEWVWPTGAEKFF